MAQESRLKPLVLIADDEVNTTIMLQRIFEREGYSVECVHNGADALIAAQLRMPDLILLDVQMPQMDGFEVLNHLRSQPETASIPAIIVTAKAQHPSDIVHGFDIGANDYIQKPFDPRELLARSQSKIRARQLEEALHKRTRELEALIRVGEELNQLISIDSILSLVPYLSLDLLMADIAIIYQLDDDLRVVAYHANTRTESGNIELDSDQGLQQFISHPASVIWPPAQAIIPAFSSGIAIPLDHSRTLLGMLVVGSNERAFDENDLRLLMGIGRQASLSIRNAQLYDIQATYALHLEEMVEEKTKDLKSTQQLLVRAEKLASIGHLAASIAHEINNPLQPIRINLEHMMEDIQSGVPIDLQGIQSTQENVERIRRIVKQLLEFTGRRETASTEMQALEVRPIVESVVSLNRKLFTQSDIHFDVDMEDNLYIYGNKDQLEQVCMNLILNAHAAMIAGDRLRIKGVREGGEVVVIFSDEGSGIPEDAINQIFDPFFSTKPNGTGLGLFVTFGIIQNHQGTIDVQSQEKIGTTFTIRFPIYEAP
jgi:signal transduction histidine kinase